MTDSKPFLRIVPNTNIYVVKISVPESNTKSLWRLAAVRADNEADAFSKARAAVPDERAVINVIDALSPAEAACFLDEESLDDIWTIADFS